MPLGFTIVTGHFYSNTLNFLKMTKLKTIIILGAIWLVSVALQGCGVSSGVQADAARQVDYSFVVVGCNRLDREDTTTANPSTANMEQLTRTFQEVAQLKPLPTYFFLAGDMVLGYTSGDTVLLARQLNAWKQVYEQSPLAATGIKLVALPGNHEVQFTKGKGSTVAAERTWLRIMQPYIVGNNGPAAGGADSLATDQSRLTYSFDYKNSHFVILDTDPVGKDSQVPTNWVAADVAAARAAGAKHIFAIGHKPAFPYQAGEGLDVFPTVRDKFWSILENANTVALLAAHNHMWFRSQPHTGKTWQVVAGNGGSKLDFGIPASASYYGFTTVSVMKSGNVLVQSYGRDLPAAGYNASAAGIATTVRDSLMILQTP
jgi:hypothetical protein